MRRLYFLSPTLEATRQIVDELLLARIPQRDIHVIANHSVALENLPEATVLENSDLIPALQKGAAIGGATGLLAGLVAIAFPPAGLVLAGGAVLMASTVAGAGVGAWAASLIGISTPNSRLRQFEDAVARGEFLILVDVPSNREEEIKALILRTHPETEVHATEPLTPAFP